MSVLSVLNVLICKMELVHKMKPPNKDIPRKALAKAGAFCIA
nr:MAG TPA: hypothetical protein [Caudoviricetes sp.]